MRGERMANEKRAFERYVFPVEKMIQATLIPANGKEAKVSARVLNISQGGLGFAAVKSQNYALEEESELILQGITGEEKLACLRGQTVKVKWILNSEIFENFGVGCEFVELSDECFECIGKLCNGR
jgi:hypothetical protein